MKLNQKILNTILEGMNFNIDNSLENDIKLSKQNSMFKSKEILSKAFLEKYDKELNQLLFLLYSLLKDYANIIKDDENCILPYYTKLENLLIITNIENLSEDKRTRLANINNRIKELYDDKIKLIDIPNLDLQSIYYEYIINEHNFERCLKLYNDTKIKFAVDNKLLRKIISIIKCFTNDNYYDSINLNWLNTYNVTDMSLLFNHMTTFNGDISEWDVSNVEDMTSMFRDAHAFNLPIGNWDVSNVTNMSSMFDNAYDFNLDISKWNISNVFYMDYMFTNAKAFNLPIGNWNTENVKNMQYTFYGAESFNKPIGNWKVNIVENMSHMFYNAKSFNLDISKWIISDDCYIANMFSVCNIDRKNMPIMFQK